MSSIPLGLYLLFSQNGPVFFGGQAQTKSLPFLFFVTLQVPCLHLFRSYRQDPVSVMKMFGIFSLKKGNQSMVCLIMPRKKIPASTNGLVLKN